MSAPRTLVVFAPERTDARLMKRINALMNRGWKVTGFTFHRDRGQPDPAPAWENVHLSTTYNRRYFHRAWCVLKAFLIVLRHRRRIAEGSCLYAINLDNSLLALFARMVSGRRLPLVVEIADVQPVMTGGGMRSRLLRGAERRVLGRSALLLTTSPGFLRNYFEPMLGYRGPVFLMENKVYPSGALVANRVSRETPVRGGWPWVIGYFGGFRCDRSMDLICRLAAAFPEQVAFVLRGVCAHINEGLLREKLKTLPNVSFAGPYRYPDELPSLYAEVDLNWCFDFSAAESNSAWLLPNRIYEGGLFHCPALAFAGTETARWVEKHRCGEVFGEDLYETLHAFLSSLTVEKWQAMRRRCMALPESLFAGESAYEELDDRLTRLA